MIHLHEFYSQKNRTIVGARNGFIFVYKRTGGFSGIDGRFYIMTANLKCIFVL